MMFKVKWRKKLTLVKLEGRLTINSRGNILNHGRVTGEGLVNINLVKKRDDPVSVCLLKSNTSQHPSSIIDPPIVLFFKYVKNSIMDSLWKLVTILPNQHLILVDILKILFHCYFRKWGPKRKIKQRKSYQNVTFQ